MRILLMACLAILRTLLSVWMRRLSSTICHISSSSAVCSIRSRRPTKGSTFHWLLVLPLISCRLFWLLVIKGTWKTWSSGRYLRATFRSCPRNSRTSNSTLTRYYSVAFFPSLYFYHFCCFQMINIYTCGILFKVYKGTKSLLSRSVVCSNYVIDVMEYAVGRLYVATHFNNQSKQAVR